VFRVFTPIAKDVIVSAERDVQLLSVADLLGALIDERDATAGSALAVSGLSPDLSGHRGT
jgi:hypothetical protein